MARIELLQFPDRFIRIVVSDSLGQADLGSVLAGQSYVLRAYKDGYVTSELQFDTIRGERTKRLYISLRPIEKKAPTAPGDTVSATSLGAPPEAVKELREGLKALNEEKDAEGSLRHFRKAVSIWPKYAEAHAMMGLAYLQINSTPEAEIALRRALEIDAKLLMAYYPLAVLLQSQKKLDEAEELLRKGMEMDPQGWKWPFELARCSVARNDWPKALTFAQTARERPNPSSKVYLLLADLYSGLGQKEKAIAALEEFTRVDPQSPYMPKVQQALADLRRPAS
jgi:tetratricopeptide (TPR) repeat protein